MQRAAHKGGSVICGDSDYGDGVRLADPRQPASPIYYRCMQARLAKRNRTIEMPLSRLYPWVSGLWQMGNRSSRYSGN